MERGRSEGDLLFRDYEMHRSPGNEEDALLNQEQQIGDASENSTVLTTMMAMLRRQIRVGILLAGSAALHYGLMAALVSLAAKVVGSLQLGGMMIPLPLLLSSSLLVVSGKPIQREWTHIIWLLASGSTVFGVTLCYMLAFENMMLGDVVSIFQLSVIFVGVISWVILKEPLRITFFFFGVLALCGVVFISRPSFIFGYEEVGDGINNFVGTLLALSAAIFAALTFVIVRKQATLDIHAYQTSVANFVLSEVSYLVCCFATGQWQSLGLEDWLLTQGIGLVYFIAQISTYLALARENATFVNIILSLQLVFAFILQLILYRESPTWTSAFGAVLVISACIGTLVIKPSNNQNCE